MSMTIMYPVNNALFDEWSADMAYILGFTITDGCLHHRTGNRQAILAYSIKDKEILEFIRDKISPTRPVKNVTYKENIKYNIKARTGYNLRIPIEKSTVLKLSKLGVYARKTGFEICPDVPEKYFGDFLRGVFDGDGCITINKRGQEPAFTIVCKNKQFLLDINVRINHLGHIYYYKKKDIYCLAIYKKSSLLYISNLLYCNNNFKLQRKYDIFQKV